MDSSAPAFSLFAPSEKIVSHLSASSWPPFGGCAMSVPIDPALLMLLMKDDGPPPKLEVVPKADEAAPANVSPAEVARDQAAAMG